MSPSRNTAFDSAIAEAVAEFGRVVTRKLRTNEGSPEDHLRGPFERLLTRSADALGLTMTAIGETRLPDLSIRPDYAVEVGGARVGYVELKKPGHGVPENWRRPSLHDRRQWDQFKLLPNVLYADGEQFVHYKFGRLQGEVARLSPGLRQAGRRLHAVGSDFVRVISGFLLWEPERPRSLDELVNLVANLCRLLRDDVAAELTREHHGHSSHQTFTDLATDWRQLLFPNLTDSDFADQYAQTITFALLLARIDGVSFHGRHVGEIARLLGKKHSLLGRALTVLTDQPEAEHSIALTTLIRVLSAVDRSEFTDHDYATLYEKFLSAYDPVLRRKSGVYYTPAPLVSFTTRFVDDILRRRLGRRLGFAERDVIVVDPAMGTGSFLAEIVNTVAATIEAEEGVGAVTPRLRELSGRLIGFENQAAPYAVAELRIHGLLKKRHRAEVPPDERRFLTDTLDDPELQQLPLGRMYEAIERSRRGANQVKRDQPVMVVIGNPPYADKAKGTAPWIESSGSLSATPSLDAFRKTGNGKLEYVLSNKYVYFWRWATWKTFDAHPENSVGVVAMICSAGFLTGPGFAGMREYLRRTADEGWIIDLSPEGHQPPMKTRLFQDNQQPICVAVFIRSGGIGPSKPAKVHRTAVAGSANDKAKALEELRIDSPYWADCIGGWTEPFHPVQRVEWRSMPALTDLLPWTSPGIKPNRTWVYAPEPESLRERWQRLIGSTPQEKGTLLKETRDIKIDSATSPLPGMTSHHGTIAAERGICPPLVEIGHRPFDRKWLIPDSRLLDTPRPALWSTASDHQIFVLEQHVHPITDGPALLFTSLLPDMDCHSGRGGRVLPLFRDMKESVPNVSPRLLDYLADILGLHVNALDLVAYIAGTVAHSGFTRRFVADLAVPGVRVPLTHIPDLWHDAVKLGREAIWLHTAGKRFIDPAAGRGPSPPRLDAGRPMVRKAIPDTSEGMPERIDYDTESQILHVGVGEISPVRPEVWSYHVATMPIVKHWFGYRKKRPTGKTSSPLDEVHATRWTAEMTGELLDLLNLLGRLVELEPRQAKLLDQVMDGPLVTIEELQSAGLVPVAAAARQIPKQRTQTELFSSG